MTTEAARVELKVEAMITGNVSFCPSRMNLRRSQASALFPSLLGQEATHLTLTVITPLAARSSVNPAFVFSVTFLSPVTYVDIMPCVVTAPPTRTLTPPRTVLPQSALTWPAMSPVDASTDQP